MSSRVRSLERQPMPRGKEKEETGQGSKTEGDIQREREKANTDKFIAVLNIMVNEVTLT